MKVHRNIPAHDLWEFGDDATVGKATAEAIIYVLIQLRKYFFGPVGNKVVHNKHGAYATGDSKPHMGHRMLDKDGHYLNSMK